MSQPDYLRQTAIAKLARLIGLNILTFLLCLKGIRLPHEVIACAD